MIHGEIFYSERSISYEARRKNPSRNNLKALGKQVALKNYKSRSRLIKNYFVESGVVSLESMRDTGSNQD